ncbi:hypothetical protein M8J76_014287 [Diaphorina citri]|nr:hypothetical protein M8J75_000095 [Diaphorina citri]KAI5724022.1 hypothetical protein M8J76_014287 [Diaphorina citri]
MARPPLTGPLWAASRTRLLVTRLQPLIGRIIGNPWTGPQWPATKIQPLSGLLDYTDPILRPSARSGRPCSGACEMKHRASPGPKPSSNPKHRAKSCSENEEEVTDQVPSRVRSTVCLISSV